MVCAYQIPTDQTYVIVRSHELEPRSQFLGRSDVDFLLRSERMESDVKLVMQQNPLCSHRWTQVKSCQLLKSHLFLSVAYGRKLKMSTSIDVQVRVRVWLGRKMFYACWINLMDVKVEQPYGWWTREVAFLSWRVYVLRQILLPSKWVVIEWAW